VSDSLPDDHGAAEEGAKAVHVDHAQGFQAGDHNVQNNRFTYVTAGGDAFVADKDMNVQVLHVHVPNTDEWGVGGISEGLKPVRAALPAGAGVFVGREADLAKLLELLDPKASGTVPSVVFISGMAGVGKSELAVQAAHAAVHNGWFPGGVLFASLGDDPKLAEIALDGFLSAVGVPGDAAPADLQARSRLFSQVIGQYAEAGMPVLVVIDNAISVGQCELLLPAGSRALVTSRDELTILGNARFYQLDVLRDEAGADLLAGRLRESLGEDTRVADYPEDARAVARLCGGLPLALWIAAAILTAHRSRSLATLAADLLDARTRLDELHWQDRDNERGVRVAFDVSYRGIRAEVARVFHLLAANPGPEISTAAAAVLTDLDQRTVRGHLEELARTHLIETGSGDARWRMHDLIRIYAGEEQPDGADDARARLTVYYMDMAAAATRHLSATAHRPAGDAFAGYAEALKWLDSEYPNLAAIALLPAPMFAYIALGLWRYFELRRRVNDGIMLTGHALIIAREFGERGREAEAMSDLGSLFRQARMFEEAMTAGRGAVAAYRSLDDQHGLGIALSNLTATLAAAERWEEAIATGRDAAAVCRSLGELDHEAIAVGNIAVALRMTGRLEESIEAFRDALSAMRQAGDKRSEGATLVNLGSALEEAGRLDEAIAAERQAAEIFTATLDRASEGMALSNLGGFLRLKDQAREAVPVLRAAVAALTDAGDAHSRGAALLNLAMALEDDGHRDDAIRALTGAVADYRQTSDHAGEGNAERDRGRALLRAGRPDEAAEALRAAAGIFRETGKQRDEGIALSLLCMVLQPGEAVEVLRAAVEIFRQTGDRHEEGLALGQLGILLPESQREEAEAALENAVAAFRELGEAELEHKAMSHLIALRSPVPTLAWLRASKKAGLVDEIAPGVWAHVTMIGGPDDEEGRRMVEEHRALIRKLAAETAGKTARKQPRRTSRKKRRRADLHAIQVKLSTFNETVISHHTNLPSIRAQNAHSRTP
jgi:tetratricopeptide (TPR) repeat protein